MGFVYAALIILAFDVLVALWGADSRPVDAEFVSEYIKFFNATAPGPTSR